MATKNRATVEALYNAPGKAELIDGQLVLMSPAGDMPGRAALNIVMSLRASSVEPEEDALMPTTPDSSSICRIANSLARTLHFMWAKEPA